MVTSSEDSREVDTGMSPDLLNIESLRFAIDFSKNAYERN